MNISAQYRRRAFSHWMRTGIWPGAPDAGGIEHKFNPYHDPRNGQFTFAPGGPRSLSHVIISHGRANSRAPSLARSSLASSQTAVARDADLTIDGQLSQAVYRPDEAPAQFVHAAPSRNPRASRGSNSGAFRDPMTLEQVFPRLTSAPAGGIVALADNFFDFTGPGRAATTALAHNWTRLLEAQIQTIEPGYKYLRPRDNQTLQGYAAEINQLRWDRAGTFLRVKGELKPLQVETLRLMQESADRAYDRGMKFLRIERLPMRLSEREALGNFIDREVRTELRERFGRQGIFRHGEGKVRVNGNEKNSTGTDLAFRRPDARIGDIAFDVTLTQKSLKTPQVRGFFLTDFGPSHVIVVRPRQEGANHTYIITRPETRK